MTTHASPRLTRMTLLFLVTIIFLSGCLMFAIGVFNSVNYMARSRAAAEANHTSTTTIGKNGTQPSDVTHHEPSFPSTSAPSVEVIFAVLTMGHAMFGIVAVTKQRPNLLATYSHLLVISCFIKMLFLIASAAMHSVLTRHQFLTNVVTLGIVTAMTELVLVCCTCQFTKLVKRGDAARQEIQSIHSYHLERQRSHSRSRSQSRARSFYTPTAFAISVSRGQTPQITQNSVSRFGSYQDVYSGVDDCDSYYVPPPIYLKLDR